MTGYMADCSVCEWSQITDTERDGQILAVLHVCLKHPDHYHRLTGKDPEQALFLYRDYAEANAGLL